MKSYTQVLNQNKVKLDKELNVLMRNIAMAIDKTESTEIRLGITSPLDVDEVNHINNWLKDWGWKLTQDSNYFSYNYYSVTISGL
jgi:hypothetical protein